MTEGRNETTMQEERKDLTIKFSGKLVSEPFTAKDGKEYVSIKIPNRDENDKSPWASFVLPANRVHEDKFGKGVWAKIPENGTTTIRKDKVVGEDEAGKRIYETEKTRIPNKYLKEMVEFYKDKDRSQDKTVGKVQIKPEQERTSLRDRLNAQKEKAEQLIKITGPNKSMQRASEAAL